MKQILTLLLLAIASLGSWLFFQQPNAYNFVNRHLNQLIDQLGYSGEFLTLEARFSPEQIMLQSKKELLPTAQYSFQDPSLKFYPYLLMDIKYLSQGKTGEGALLWGLEDGEMVINTETWEKTHGFEDCINADANVDDFALMLTILRSGGSIDKDVLIKKLKGDSTLERYINSARQKHLIVEKNNQLAVHLKDPKLDVLPQTRISQWLVTKPYLHLNKINRRYSANQIIKVASAAFGPDFAVRHTQEVFLPVYTIVVKNPDGSSMTSHWNALTGKRMEARYPLL